MTHRVFHITVLWDPTCRMAEVRLNDKCELVGNYDDFYAQCHGEPLHLELSQKYGWFHGAGEFAHALKRKLIAEGAKTVEVIHSFDKKYTSAGRWVTKHEMDSNKKRSS